MGYNLAHGRMNDPWVRVMGNPNENSGLAPWVDKIQPIPIYQFRPISKLTHISKCTHSEIDPFPNAPNPNPKPMGHMYIQIDPFLNQIGPIHHSEFDNPY